MIIACIVWHCMYTPNVASFQFIASTKDYMLNPFNNNLVNLDNDDL